MAEAELEHDAGAEAGEVEDRYDYASLIFLPTRAPVLSFMFGFVCLHA